MNSDRPVGRGPDSVLPRSAEARPPDAAATMNDPRLGAAARPDATCDSIEVEVAAVDGGSDEGAAPVLVPAAAVGGAPNGARSSPAPRSSPGVLPGARPAEPQRSDNATTTLRVSAPPAGLSVTATRIIAGGGLPTLVGDPDEHAPISNTPPDDESWTPYQPSVAEGTPASTVPTDVDELGDSVDLDIDELSRLDEVLSPAPPAVVARSSDTAELTPDDLLSVESAPPPLSQLDWLLAPASAVPAARTRVASVPPVPPPAAAGRGSPTQAQQAQGPAAAAPVSAATGRLHLPTSLLAPAPMLDAPVARKRTRPWWEELFNDDFLRTLPPVTDAQIGREVSFIEESLGVQQGAMLLDLACGLGRHAVALSGRGYQVVGLDLSLAMLARAAEIAQERRQKMNFVQGDMREMTFEGMFDGVYCWNTSFGFFEEEKNAQVIGRVARALKKGGQFLLEVINRDFVIRQAPSLAWFEADGCICMDEMQIDWITSRMKIKRTMMLEDGRNKEIEYSVRVYSLHELGKLLHDHGFRVAEVSGRTSTPGVFFGNESPSTMILAEKR